MRKSCSLISTSLACSPRQRSMNKSNRIFSYRNLAFQTTGCLLISCEQTNPYVRLCHR